MDDLDRYLAIEGARGFDAALLGRLAATDPPARILATIRLEEFGRLADTPGELGRVLRELLNRFDPAALTLPVGFEDPTEQMSTSKLYPGEQVSGGLAEHLAAAHELVDRLEVGQTRVPEGAGLVLAAVDCHRAGLDRPISKADLAALLPLYLKQLRPLRSVQDGDVDRGFGWATEPVGRTAALLIADPNALSDTFRVADPIIDYVERRDGRRLHHPAVWDYLVARVSVEEALDVGFAAYTREEYSAAAAAWRKVISSGRPDKMSLAAFSLGGLLSKQGDVAGARTAYERAIDSGHQDWAPAATHNLAVLLKEQGDVAGARVAYERAIDSDHQDMAPLAALSLAELLEEEGNVAGARAAYERVIDISHQDMAPWAAVGLGQLFEEQGDLASARVAYQRAIDSLHPEARAAAQEAVQNLDRTD